MSVDKATSWAFCEDVVAEDEVLVGARERAAELGTAPVSSGTGALLTVLASTAQAQAVVEIGTGTGVASLYLLRGMVPNGVLTTIDAEAEHHRAAKEAFAEAGIKTTRTRTIAGRASDVLTRLTESAYDLVFINTDPEDVLTLVDQAYRLLRPAGLLVVNDALWHDPGRRSSTPRRADHCDAPGR
jgi:predicted O-methyltransferase YrrM